MDWLTFKFCVLIWILCVSKSQSQLHNSTNTSNQLRSACLEGQPVVPPDPCNTCICFSGQVYCTNLSCQEKECVKGMELPQPDECNKCICQQGKVTCTDMICIPAPQCTENHVTYPTQNKCNACTCKDGFLSCTSNVCVEEPLTTTTKTTKPKKKEKCVEGSRLPGPDQCLDCICQNGKKRCKNVCNPVVESRFHGPECYAGQHLPMPDECNNCVCFEGQIHCTHIPCRMDTRIAPQCTDDHQVYRPDECNECYCIEGRLECSDLVCIRGSKCVVGQVIPKPDSCNTCKCVNGYILCTHHQCAVVSRNALLPVPSATGVMPLEDCQEGDYIPPPPPPNDCNTCYCMDNLIVCTMNSCEGPIPGFKGRLKEKNKKTNLEIFDKKISVEPFINILYTKNDKIPHKLTHSHTYNGFHQEIKVHASHLPKDTNKILNALANSLDNAALASISQKLLTSNSVTSNQDSKKPFDHSVNQTIQLGDGNVLSAQTSKLITSGSQSNETILVFPHTKPTDDNVSLSVLPLESKHETIWKPVSAPDTLVYNIGIQNLSLHGQKQNVKDYNDKPLAMLTPIDSNPLIRNKAKFGLPGQHYGLPIKPARDPAVTPIIHTQSIYPTLHPKPIIINNGNHTPFSPPNKQTKPAPSSFVANHDELPHLRPFQSTKSRPNHIINHTSPTLVFRPELYPDNNVGQQKLSQYQFAPNPSNFYPNQGTPEQFQSKPKRLLSLPINYYNNKGVPSPPQYLNNPNPHIVSSNQYKSPQLGLKLAPGSSYPNNIPLNPALTNLPYHKNRISTIDTEVPHFEPNSKAHHSDVLIPSQNEVKPKHKQPNSPQSQWIPNPSIYYKNEYEAPKIIEEDPDKDQLTPNSIISYKHTEDYDPLHTPSESGFEKLPHKVRNKSKKYNTTHSHYTSVTHFPEYNPNDPDEDSLEFDLTKKVDHYLNIPYLQLDPKSIQSYLTLPGQRQNDTLHPSITEINKYDQHDSWNITNIESEKASLSPSKSKQTVIKTKLKGTYSVSPNTFAIYPHKSSKTQLGSPQDNSEKEGSEDPTHPKSNLPLESKHETTWKTVSAPDTLVYNNGIQILLHHRQEENGKDYYDKPSAMITPIDLNPIFRNPVKLSLPGQHYGLPTKPARDTADTPSIPTQSIYPTLHPKPININYGKMIYAPFSLENKQIKPAPSSFVANHDELPHFRPFQSTKPRPNHIINHTSPTPVFRPELNPDNNVGQQKPSQYQFALNPSNFYPNQGAPEQFQSKPKRIPSLPINDYKNKGVSVPLVPKSNDNLPPPSQTGPENQHTPGVFDDQGSNNEFQYSHNAYEDPRQFKPLHKLPPPKLETSHNHQLSAMFDEHRPADGVQSPFYLTEDLTHPKVKFNKASHFDPYKSMLNDEQPKDNQHIPLYSQFGPTQNQHKPGDNHGVEDGFQYAHNANEDHRELKPFYELPPSPTPNKQTLGMLDERVSPDGFRHPFYLAENSIHSRGNLHNLPPNQFEPDKIPQGSADGFHYPSKSADVSLLPKDKLDELFINNGPTENPHESWRIEDRGFAGSLQSPPSSTEDSSFPKNNPDTTPESNFKQSPNQLKPSSLDQIPQYISENYNDITENQLTSNNYSSNNPVRPRMYLDHDHFKPSSFDNLPNGVHNIPWSLPEDDDKVVNSVSSTRPPRFEPDDDQYKPSSFDNLFSGIQHMPKPDQDNNALGSNDELTTPQSVFKPEQDQNENIDLFDEDDDHLQIEINNATDIIHSDSMQNNLDHRIKPDNVPDSLLSTDGGQFSDYCDKLYPLIIAFKKLSDLSNNNSDLGIMDELELLFVSAMSGIADILNYKLSKEQDDDVPVENQVIQRIFPLKKLISKLNQLTDNDNRILNLLKSLIKLIKLISTKDNTTETKNENDLTKIFSRLSELTSNRIKTSTENIPFNGFDPEIVEKIMNDFKEDIQTVTPTPCIVETTNDNDNQFHPVSIAIEETQQQDTKKYPEVHNILNQPDDGDAVDIPLYIEADGEAGLASDMRSKEVHSPLFPIMIQPRFRHRPQAQKDECGDGTQWISNCHTCSCYFGQTMCLRMQDCKLRPFGEPMICKPYSYFKMGCYTCECNGDGVAECDATDCGKEPKGKRQGSHELALPIYHEFFDKKKTDEILQYYKFHKKLPKNCPRHNSETEYPTCKRGTSWISSCHKCECNERGKHECTKINDCVLDFDSYGKPGRCKPNSKFYPRTNSMRCVECLCSDEGIPYCPEADLKKH